MSLLPKQKIPKAEKTPEWYKDNIKYLITQSNFWSSDRWEMIQLNKAANGDLDQSAYKYVLNPFNVAEENLINFPAQMRNMDIISPILNSYIGEKANRPFNHMVVVANPDSPNETKIQEEQEFTKALAQKFVNALNESGVQTGVPSKEVTPFEKIPEKYQNMDASDLRALFGQEVVNYLKYQLNLKDKYQEGFYDWLVTGRVFTYKDVYKNDLQHEIVPPLEMWYGTTRTGFIEDAGWALRKTRYNLSQCIDRFHEVLKPTEIDALEQKFRDGNTGATIDITFSNSMPVIDKASNAPPTNSINISRDLIDVWHATWKGFEKVGILVYIDEFGQQQEAEVSEDYVLDTTKGDISIEWSWNSCVYEVYRIGEDLYKYDRKLLVQRNELSNTSVVKLPYNGRVGYNERYVVRSVVKQLLNYQALYNIFHFRREMVLARNKDKLTLFPIGLMPDEFSPDAEGMSRFLNYVEATGLLFFDETKPNAAAVLSALRAIDVSLGNYVAELTNIIMSIKQEAWDAVGMNRQRYGDSKASDGKAVTEQALFRSATITREMFRRFERFEETDIQGLIDYSKVAWINGKKGMYINSAGRKVFLEVNPEQHLESDYQIFAIDSEEEAEKLRMAKDYAFGWAQNKSSTSASMVLEVIDSNNMSFLKNAVRKAEQAEREYQEAMQQQQAQAAQALEEQKAAAKQEEIGSKERIAQLKSDTDIQVALIGANSRQADGQNSSNDLGNDYNEALTNIEKGYQDSYKNGQATLDRLSKERAAEAQIALKEKQLAQKPKSSK